MLWYNISKTVQFRNKLHFTSFAWKSTEGNSQRQTHPKKKPIYSFERYGHCEISPQLPATLHRFHRIIVLNNVVKVVYSLFQFHSIFGSIKNGFPTIISWLSGKAIKKNDERERKKYHRLTIATNRCKVIRERNSHHVKMRAKRYHHFI